MFIQRSAETPVLGTGRASRTLAGHPGSPYAPRTIMFGAGRDG